MNPYIKLKGNKKKLIKIRIVANTIFIHAWYIWFWLIFSIGAKNEVAAIMRIRLAILLPTTAPTAKSEWLLTTALIALANSGNEVPPATITIPIAKSETLNYFPKLTDPRTTISAPNINSARPTKRKIKFTNF